MSALWVDFQTNRPVSTGLTCTVNNCSLFPLLETVLPSFSSTQSTLCCPPPAGFMAISSGSPPTQVANPSMSFLVSPAPHPSPVGANKGPFYTLSCSDLIHLLTCALFLRTQSIQTFYLPLYNSLNPSGLDISAFLAFC